MNKTTFAVFSHRFFFLFILILISCSTKKISQTADWSIFVYMAADNSLDEAAISDIEEMQRGIFSDKINVIVQIDHRNENPVSSYTGAERLHIFPSKKEIISQIGEIDSGDGENLSEFLRWGIEKYPAKHFALSIWSHGNGWYDAYNKFCPDKTSLSSINIPQGELKSALENVHKHLDIIILDACNMQSMELITEIHSFSDFIIGSEDTVREDGFPYDDILSEWENYSKTENLAMNITKLFVESYQPYTGSQNPYGNIFPVTCSTIKTENLTPFYDKIEHFSAHWIESYTQLELLESRENCFELNDPEMDVDLYEFFDLLPANSLNPQAEISNIFLNNFAFYPAQNNLNLIDKSSSRGFCTVWFPDNNNDLENLKDLYEQMDFSNFGWSNFLIDIMNKKHIICK